MKSLPSYVSRLKPGELRNRAARLREMMRECRVCPRACGARRLDGCHGVCRSADQVVISSAGPHFGEEAPLVGTQGSGTIFFTSCNLKCVFCQNYEISQLRRGHPVSARQLAGQMVHLQELGCHNINLVTPTHFAPHIVEALTIAAQEGLSIPIVYNCGGYESVETLRLLEDVVDIYMPDIKYSDNDHARNYSGVRDYWEVVRDALREMHRQVGDLRCADDDVAERGLIIRHLVLPNDVAGSDRVLDFVAEELSINSFINIMDQYRPTYHASRLPELNRRPTPAELHGVIAHAARIGLHRGFDRPFRLLESQN